VTKSRNRKSSEDRLPSLDEAREIISRVWKANYYTRVAQDPWKLWKLKVRSFFSHLQQLEKKNPRQAQELRNRLHGFVKELQEKERDLLKFTQEMEKRLREGVVEDTSPQCMNVKERIAKLYEEYRDIFDTIINIMEEIYEKCVEPCEKMWEMEDRIVWGYYGYDADTIVKKAREASDIARRVMVYGRTCHDWATLVAGLRYRYRGKRLTELDPVKKLGLVYDYYRLGIYEIAKTKLGTEKLRRLSEALDRLNKLMQEYMHTCNEREVSVVLCREYNIRQLWTRFRIPIP